MVIPPHAQRVAHANARLAAEGRCIMHNSDVTIPAQHLLELPIGNVLPLCGPCLDWWKADAAETGDPMTQPVNVTDLPPTVRKIAYAAPLASGTCKHCGQNVLFNLAIGHVEHATPNDTCPNPWPAP